MENKALILVTGASGFIAMHTILKLLEQGYRVRGTLRDLARESETRATLAQHSSATAALEFARADLLNAEGWADAVRGCEYVIHTASPLPLFMPPDENELIAPARDGTLRVLRAAHEGGVKRVVFLSTMAAMVSGHERESRTFDESDWTNLDHHVGAYAKSKTLAERAAWDFIQSAENKNGMELVSINPSNVFGPFLDAHPTTSSVLFETLLRRQVPGVARTKFSFVDVRDVADALVSGMITRDAAGQRFCCATLTPWLQYIALTLAKHFSTRGYRVPTRELPSIIVRAIALFDPKVRIVVPALDWNYDISTARIQTVLSWQPRDPETTIVEMAESMIRLGLV